MTDTLNQHDPQHAGETPALSDDTAGVPGRIDAANADQPKQDRAGEHG